MFIFSFVCLSGFRSCDANICAIVGKLVYYFYLTNLFSFI